MAEIRITFDSSFLRDAPSSAIAFAKFAKPAALAAFYEWEVRMLADVTPELSKAAFNERLESVEDAVFGHPQFAALLSEDEVSFLAEVRRLRNKLFHLSVAASRLKLAALGFPNRPAAIKVATVTDPLTLASFKEDVANAQPFAVDVSPTHGSLFGWRLQLANDGSLEHSGKVFERALGIIARLDAARSGIDF
jgi:hypothetical protein